MWFQKNCLGIILLMILPLTGFSQDIVINEVMSSNDVTIFDEDGDASDWIELYNGGSSSVNLSGYYLSDDLTEAQKWQFSSNAIIEANGYLLIFASDKNIHREYWHTNFKISASGEDIVLSDASGTIVDQIFVPESESDISFGRENDGSLSWMFQLPTPGTTNSGTAIQELSDPVTASVQAGFYSSTVSVELSAGTADIYYTLDASDPDSDATKYSGPVNITETTVLRAVSYKEGYLPSPVMNSTYFINVSTDLPVISLISDPYNLFDYNYGIYELGPNASSNPPYYGANFWMDWERPAHIQFFDDDHDLGFSEDCGIEIYGAYTRSYPQKSLAVKFKDPYNSSPLEYPLFPDRDLTTYKSFILRNSGNDFDYTHFRDAMQQTLVQDLDIDYLEYRPAAAYINGDYWGIYNIREKINEHYVAYHHGADPDNIDMLEGHSDLVNGNLEVIHGDTQHYAELISYISNNDMNTDAAYAFIDSMIDLDNCLLYYAAQVYYNNQDWPANNIKYWRPHTKDGKWRWFLYDLDFGFNLYETTGQSENHVYYIFSGVETRPGSNPPWSTLLPRKLVENTAIKNKFINQVVDLLNTNFQSTRVKAVIDDMASHIANEGVKHREHWGISQWTYNDHINRMKTFADERPGYLRGFMRDFFNCGTDGTITINAAYGGKVKLNTITLIEADLPWSGKYFINIPIEITAIPDKGYKFDGWSGSVTSADESITLNVSRVTYLTATFLVDSTVQTNIVINEINYNSADNFNSGDWIELYNASKLPVDISGWYYSDSDESHKFFLAAGTVLEPAQYLVIAEDTTAFLTCFPGVTNFVGETGFGLSGSGEFMKIVDANGLIIDSLTYDDASPWPTEADGDGATLELVDAESDNSLGENWQASDGHGTPGARNSGLTAIEDEPMVVLREFVLQPNYPNPFNAVTTIGYSIAESGFVTLAVFDLSGKRVSTLVQEYQHSGSYDVYFDGSHMASGIYFYKLSAGEQSQIRKLTLLK